MCRFNHFQMVDIAIFCLDTVKVQIVNRLKGMALSLAKSEFYYRSDVF